MRYLTAGESHGPCLVAIVDDVPAHLRITPREINQELKRRQIGYGRSERMRIEKDEVEILAGVRNNKTTGSPIAFLIKNKDYSYSGNPRRLSVIARCSITRVSPLRDWPCLLYNRHPVALQAVPGKPPASGVGNPPCHWRRAQPRGTRRYRRSSEYRKHVFPRRVA